MKLITFLMFFLQIATVMSGRQMTQTQNYSPAEIDKAWIKVPWTHGCHYWHNTLTRDDQDNTPSYLLK